MTLSKPWSRKREKNLLEYKISSLDLKIEGSAIEPLIGRLYRELAQKGLAYRPPCFLADEWFCPVGIPAIGIPFYLAHSRLRKIEQKNILEVEGGAKSEFMRLIRHEAGHAYSYAYLLYKRKKWQQLFGLASQDYPDTYKPKPYSKSYVLHLDNWYAQSHPDEDFAETFAVWLTPKSKWKTRYRGWRALKKIEYVDELMKSIAGKKEKHNPPFNPKEYAGLNIKLKTYYKTKRKLYEESYPDFYDKDLKTLFTDKIEERGGIKAAKYLRSHYPDILKSVATWTKEKKYTVDQLLDGLIKRSAELNLYIRKDMANADIQVSSYITTLVMTYLFTGQFKRTK